MIDKCPECDAELQATVPLYLSNVVLDDDGFMESWKLAFEDDLLSDTLKAVTDCDPNDIEIYCANDHAYEPEG